MPIISRVVRALVKHTYLETYINTMSCHWHVIYQATGHTTRMDLCRHNNCMPETRICDLLFNSKMATIPLCTPCMHFLQTTPFSRHDYVDMGVCRSARDSPCMDHSTASIPQSPSAQTQVTYLLSYHRLALQYLHMDVYSLLLTPIARINN